MAAHKQETAHPGFYRRMVEQVRDYAIFAMDPGRRVLTWNPAAEEMLGYTANEMIGKLADIIFTPEDLDLQAPAKEIARAAREGKANDNRWHLRKDGTRLWVHGIVSPLHDEDEQLLGFVKVLRDNTEYRRVNEALQHANDRSTEILEAISDGFIALNREWRFIFVNQQAARLLEHSREGLLGRVLWEEFPGAVGSTFDTQYRHAMEDRVPVEFEEYYPPLGRWFEVRAYPIEEGLAVFFLDATSRRQTEEERRKLELEHALDAQLAAERARMGRELHDGIRQQLTGIQMLARNLHKKLDRRAVPEAGLIRDFAHLVGEANHDLRELIHDLVPPRVDAPYLLGALERAARHIEEWYGVPCELVAPSSIPLKNDEAANHLYYLAREAMTNAAKHSRASRIEVVVRVMNTSLILQVHDDGLGLPAEYERHESMGMRNMRYRAELIGASLDIAGSSQAGTTVTCVLPLAEH